MKAHAVKSNEVVPELRRNEASERLDFFRGFLVAVPLTLLLWIALVLVVSGRA
jgi:hypothetical protein